jgi:hypothetical protein
MSFRVLLAIGLAVLLGSWIAAGGEAGKPPAKFEVQLLWGTDLSQSPDPSHKAVDADVGHKLNSLPLRFKNYFLVKKESLALTTGDTKKVQMSAKCEVELHDVDHQKFCATFFGKGKQTSKRTQAFPKGEMLVHGGNAPGSNAWLIVVKRVN